MGSIPHARRILLGVLIGIATASSLPAFAQKAFLRENQALKDGEYLVNENKSLFAIMQGDGNFCAYAGSGPADNRGFRYCTQTNGTPGPHYATQMASGRFCIYRGTPFQGQRLLCTGGAVSSAKDGEPHFAILQNDGNFAIYRGTGPSNNRGLVWDVMSGTRMSSSEQVEYFFNNPKSAMESILKR